MYEITYDWNDERNITEMFEGEWDELHACLKEMRRNDCYNIDATYVAT